MASSMATLSGVVWRSKGAGQVERYFELADGLLTIYKDRSRERPLSSVPRSTLYPSQPQKRC